MNKTYLEIQKKLIMLATFGMDLVRKRISVDAWYPFWYSFIFLLNLQVRKPQQNPLGLK